MAGVERIQGGNLDEPIAYDGNDEFKAACDAVDLMAAKLKAALDDEQSRKELIAGMSHDPKSPLTSIRAYSEAIRDGVAQKPEMRRRYIETICREDLYELIWGLGSMGDNITVAVHINRLREKVELDPSHPQMIQTVWGVGYRLNAV